MIVPPAVVSCLFAAEWQINYGMSILFCVYICVYCLLNGQDRDSDRLHGYFLAAQYIHSSKGHGISAWSRNDFHLGGGGGRGGGAGVDSLPKRQTIGICDGHEDLSSC